MHTRQLPRIATAVALAALTATTLSACGGDDSEKSAASSDKKSGSSATVAGVKIKKDAALHDSLPGAIKSSGTVRVASDVPYPPFEMFVKEGETQLTGLDYDLAQAIGAKLGVDFKFTPQAFDGIIPAIQAGKYDVAMSAMTDNKERQQVLDFVDYSQSGSGIMVKKGNPEKIRTLDDLCGKKVGVQTATNQLDLLKSHQKKCGGKKIDIQTFPKDSDAQLALRSGKVVADVLTKPAAGWTAKTADGGNSFEVVDDPQARAGYNASPNGIGISKKLPELTDAVQKALQALIDDGTAGKIGAKYGIESIMVEKATKNGAVD